MQHAYNDGRDEKAQKPTRNHKNDGLVQEATARGPKKALVGAWTTSPFLEKIY